MGQNGSKVCAVDCRVSKDECDYNIEPLDVLIFSREEQSEQKLAKCIKDSLVNSKVECCDSTWNDERAYCTMEKSKCLIYIIGEKYIDDDIGGNVVWGAFSFKKTAFIASPKEKQLLWKDIPTGFKMSFKDIKWFVVDVQKQQIPSMFLDEITTITTPIQSDAGDVAGKSRDNSISSEEDSDPSNNSSKEEGVEPDNSQVTTNIDKKKSKETVTDGASPKTIDEKILCADLEKIASKWEDFGTMVIGDFDEVKKIGTNNMGKDSMVDYCFNRVICAWLKGKKEYRTKEVLAEALKVAHQPGLAARVTHDPSFQFSQVYLQKLLRPVKYKYCEFGIQLGLQLPRIKKDEAVRGNCDYCLTMVIMKWFEGHPKRQELWEALEYINEEGLKEELSEKYEEFVFPGDIEN